MIVYVIFEEHDGEGCSWPQAVFSTYEKAKAYIDAGDSEKWEIDSYVVDELEIINWQLTD